MMSLRPRAQRLAQADLAGALRHRHQHDVHDADAAHEQRDRRDARQQQGERLRGLLHGAQQRRLIADVEVRLLARAQPVLAPEDLVDLHHGVIHPVLARGLHGDGAHADRCP